MKNSVPMIGFIASAFLIAPLSTANAANMVITAMFRADSSKPHENKFVNTTPNSGYCSWYPASCQSQNVFSLSVPGFNTRGGSIAANHTNPREGAMLKAPANWRTVQITHGTTGETKNVEIRVVGIAATYVLHPFATEIVGGGASALEAHSLLWNGAWMYAPSPCTGAFLAAFTPQSYRFYWRTPVEAVCSKQARYPIQHFRFWEMSFTYEMRTPNPLQMSSGQYAGALTYRLGPGQDFDFGDVVIPVDPNMTINFRLNVEHALKVDIPPGGNRVELAPQDGWQAWLSRGRAPSRLFRDQTFRISSSARFKMHLECQYTIGNTCAIWDGDGHSAPVDVSVSLPHGLTDASGQAVKRRPLLRDGSGTQLFQPGFYVDHKPGTLHFEISRANAEQMVAEGDGTYSGNVTVVWDSDI
ncbi:hypothetical protein M8Q45_19155 [Pseudomonas sp. T1.Ur]|nr:hypothetical protein [Pseudomonas sp. T1.Ur]MCL6703588.1 hypothetical protein [Pseudomonas sp. T1.Ur]